jgi:hypothetical protein
MAMPNSSTSVKSGSSGSGIGWMMDLQGQQPGHDEGSLEIILARCTSPQLCILVQATLEAMKEAIRRPLMEEVHLWWTQFLARVSAVSLKQAEELLRQNPNISLEQVGRRGRRDVNTWDEVSYEL